MTVVSLIRDTKTRKNALYRLREEYGLTVTQAAAALEISATQFEREELRDRPIVCERKARQRFEIFCARNADHVGKNLVFGYLPLRVARDFMGLSVEGIADKYSLSASQWRKMECHARTMPVAIIDQIEGEMMAHFATLCEKFSK